MKKSLLLAFMLMIAANIFAQQQMATLNHNDTITVFYGNYALRDAHNAAVAGDIVTLSPGTFEKCDITKPITLRGAGATVDTIAGTYPTIIAGDFKLDIPKHTEYYLVIEGVYMSQEIDIKKLYNAKFNRCNIYKLKFGYISYAGDNSGIAENVEFVNCLIRQINNNCYYSSTSNFTFVNCALYWESCEIPSSFINSLLIMRTDFSKSTAYNSIITRNHHYGYFGETAGAYNCIFVKNNNHENIFRNETNNTNVIFEKLNEVFETWHSWTNEKFSFSFDERYILKEEIATSFLGSDGTEVGIHGGMFPFDTRPSYMVVKKCNVANKSTIDGKLSVDIEVMVEE